MSDASSANLPHNPALPTGAEHYSAGQSHPEPPDPTIAHGRHHVHAVPPKVLLGVYGCLLVLTILTVAVTFVNLGRFAVVIALAIAVAKAGLVAMYFMHLRWDSPFNGIVLIVAFFFVALFIGLAVMDTHYYADEYNRPGTGQAMQSSLGPRQR
jgi:cytochrome c oxidase subunit 4